MENSKKGFLKTFVDEYLSYVIVIIIVLLIKKFVVSPIKVNGESMMTTLHDKDIMILNIIGYKINGADRFDIVVVDTPNEYIIKRVIGLPGETVEYKDNQLYINGEKVEDNHGSQVTNDFKVKLGKDEYYVLGDNRTNSIDSRIYGAFNKNKILGKTKLIVFPFKRFGNKK